MVDGFFKVDVAPFPKSQSQTVGLPVEASVKLTTSGEHPVTGAAVKPAVGACAKATHDSHTQISVRMTGLRINLLNLNVWYLANAVGGNVSAPLNKNCS